MGRCEALSKKNRVVSTINLPVPVPKFKVQWWQSFFLRKKKHFLGYKKEEKCSTMQYPKGKENETRTKRT